MAMLQGNRNRLISRAALCAAFSLVLVLAGGGAAPAGDDDGDLPDTKFIKNLLRGFGLRNGEEPTIEQQERPRLVLPPSHDLPAPVPAGSLKLSNPAWPTDPDEVNRAAERKARAERKSFDPYKAGDALKPSELAAGRTDRPGVKTSDGPDTSPEKTPSQLGYTGGLFQSILGVGKTFTGEKEVETATFVREPSRNKLTDPPAGYRTPSSTQPYGINGKADAPKRSAADRQTDTVDK